MRPYERVRTGCITGMTTEDAHVSKMPSRGVLVARTSAAVLRLESKIVRSYAPGLDVTPIKLYPGAVGLS